MTRQATPTSLQDDGSSRLTIDLGALQENYTHLASLAPGSETAAVVKANGYGLGTVAAARALYEAGARTFFVAHLSEALALRAALEEPRVMVLNGFFPESADAYTENRISPVINTPEQVKSWLSLPLKARTQGAALHVDTGMSRLGLRMEETENSLIIKYLTPFLIMSHLACADTPEHFLNARQLENFRQVMALFPDVPGSLANSAGIYLGADYHFALNRPGIALYGSHPGPLAHGLKPVITLEARVLQLRKVEPGETVGYGATYHADAPRTIATLACGYADGFLRSASSSVAAYEGVRYPLAGRISMDLLAVDVTGAPASLKEGSYLELVGPNVNIDEVAEKAGTIAYEFLTGLGMRYHRTYLGTA